MIRSELPAWRGVEDVDYADVVVGAALVPVGVVVVAVVVAGVGAVVVVVVGVVAVVVVVDVIAVVIVVAADDAFGWDQGDDHCVGRDAGRAAEEVSQGYVVMARHGHAGRHRRRDRPDHRRH